MTPYLLLVEDNQHIQRIYKTKFEAEGFRVGTADNGEDGLVMAERCNPDVIVLDIMLPKIDGFEVLKQLRADPKLSHIPVFMLSNKAWADDVQHALSLGARQFFSKGSSTLQEIVRQIRTECAFKKLAIISNQPDGAKPILALVQHPKLLCSLTTMLMEAGGNVERGAPELVILDARQPSATIFSLLQQLKTTPATQALPVIAVTDAPDKLKRADVFVGSAHLDTELRPAVLRFVGLMDAPDPSPALQTTAA